ncbi:hypothetical protein CYMTET_26856, partial [Cymbomonas tetramitiformis]
MSSSVDKSVGICSTFDSGNIKLVGPISVASGVHNVPLEIIPEMFTEVDGRAHFQWYHFRASGVKDKKCCFKIVNAGKASYPDAYIGYQSCASYDRKYWFRVPDTVYNKTNGELCFEHTPVQDLCYYAYFAPYSMEQHADLVAWAGTTGLASVRTIGYTCDGYPLDMVTAGTGPKKLWVIARQHPGESMAEWWMDGFLHRLLDAHDPMARKLLEEATFHVVPNMCPDGSRRGHLRTNARGRNLNREWKTPCPENSPEVFHVLREMADLGCDFNLDVHGDEELPYNFIAGSEGIPGTPSPSTSPLCSVYVILFVE